MKCTATETKHETCTFYGIRLQTGSESVRIDDICADKAAIESLCEKIEKGSVSPDTLMYIVEDFME